MPIDKDTLLKQQQEEIQNLKKELKEASRPSALLSVLKKSIKRNIREFFDREEKMKGMESEMRKLRQKLEAVNEEKDMQAAIIYAAEHIRESDHSEDHSDDDSCDGLPRTREDALKRFFGPCDVSAFIPKETQSLRPKGTQPESPQFQEAQGHEPKKPQPQEPKSPQPRKDQDKDPQETQVEEPQSQEPQSKDPQPRELQTYSKTPKHSMIEDSKTDAANTDDLKSDIKNDDQKSENQESDSSQKQKSAKDPTMSLNQKKSPSDPGSRASKRRDSRKRRAGQAPILERSDVPKTENLKPSTTDGIDKKTETTPQFQEGRKNVPYRGQRKDPKPVDRPKKQTPPEDEEIYFGFAEDSVFTPPGMDSVLDDDFDDDLL